MEPCVTQIAATCVSGLLLRFKQTHVILDHIKEKQQTRCDNLSSIGLGFSMGSRSVLYFANNIYNILIVWL